MTAERVVAGILRDKKEAENHSSFQISSGGRQLNVKLGKENPLKSVSSETLFNIKRSLGEYIQYTLYEIQFQSRSRDVPFF